MVFGAVVACGALLLWAAGSTLFEMALLYRERLAVHRKNYDNSVYHLTYPESPCLPENALHRVRMGEKKASCIESELVIARWPQLEAFYDTLRQFEFCPWGKCLEFHLGLFGMINLVGGAVMFGCTFVILVIVFWGSSYLWGKVEESSELPFHASSLHAASYVKETAHCHAEHTSSRNKED